MNQSIATNIQQVKGRIAAACDMAGRAVQSVTLLAVSKTQPACVVREAFHAGLRHFGENYVQEGLDKIETLADLRSQIEWHFIGPLQRNKTRAVATHFDWVHSIDRLAIAERLSQQRSETQPPLQVCIQVNVSAEASKSGVAPEALLALAADVARLPRLRLRGLMSIPEPEADPTRQRASHRRLRELVEALRERGMVLDTLSMGMSADLEAAIHEGATLVRIGTALFGARAAGGDDSAQT